MNGFSTNTCIENQSWVWLNCFCWSSFVSCWVTYSVFWKSVLTPYLVCWFYKKDGSYCYSFFLTTTFSNEP